MAGDGQGDQAAEEEPNLYLVTLQQCRDSLIPSARDAVYAGQGDPGSSIAGAVNGGGWECTSAGEWVTELLEHTRTVLPAFDDAIGDVGAAISAERAAHGGKDTVPKDHPHGLAWSRSWHNIQRMNQY
jgi:hypothetical protein